ncbi:hypothetical protein KM043_011736 [Ampulex compressa]|nr:hypothetical protein KM043_011736 [Ampulex compressa]
MRKEVSALRGDKAKSKNVGGSGGKTVRDVGAGLIIPAKDASAKLASEGDGARKEASVFGGNRVKAKTVEGNKGRMQNRRHVCDTILKAQVRATGANGKKRRRVENYVKEARAPLLGARSRVHAEKEWLERSDTGRADEACYCVEAREMGNPLRGVHADTPPFT